MKAALHQRFRSAGAYQFYSLLGRSVAVFGVDELHVPDVETELLGRMADPFDRTDPDGLDQPQPHRGMFAIGVAKPERMIAGTRKRNAPSRPCCWVAALPP